MEWMRGKPRWGTGGETAFQGGTVVGRGRKGKQMPGVVCSEVDYVFNSLTSYTIIHLVLFLKIFLEEGRERG